MRRLKAAAILGTAIILLWLAAQVLAIAVYRGKAKRLLGDLAFISTTFQSLPLETCQSETSCLAVLNTALFKANPYPSGMRDIFNRPYSIRIIETITLAELAPRCCSRVSRGRYHVLAWSNGFDGVRDSEWPCGTQAPWDPEFNDILFLDGVPVQLPGELTSAPFTLSMFRRWLLRSRGA